MIRTSLLDKAKPKMGQGPCGKQSGHAGRVLVLTGGGLSAQRELSHVERRG